MGLDAIDLVMSIEERFGINLDLDALSQHRALTAGDLHDQVLARLGNMRRQRCRSSIAFYQLRRAIVTTFGAPRHQVRPGTPTASLLAGQRLPCAWAALQRQLGLRLPPLLYPGWLLPANTCLAALLICTPLAMILIGPLALAAMPLLIVLIVLANRVGERNADLPDTGRRIGQLAVALVDGVPPDPHLEPHAAWNTLQALIAEAAGVPLEQVTPTARLFEDIGL